MRESIGCVPVHKVAQGQLHLHLNHL